MAMFSLKKKFGRLARLGEQPLHQIIKKEGGERFLHPKTPPPPSFKKRELTRLAVFASPSHFWLHFAFIFGIPTHSSK